MSPFISPRPSFEDRENIALVGRAATVEEMPDLPSFVFGGNGDSLLVFEVDMILLAILVFFALLALPRAIARFSYIGAWRSGFRLRSTGPTKASQSPNFFFPAAEEKGYAVDSLNIPDTGDKGRSQSLSLQPPTSTCHHIRARSSVNPIQVESKPTDKTDDGHLVKAFCPRPSQSWASRCPRISGLLDIRVFSGFSVGQAFIVMVYLAVIGYFAFVQANPLNYPERAALIAMCQIPIVVALACKTNLVGTLIGHGYEKLNFLHRYSGLVLALMGNLHTMHYSTCHIRSTEIL